MEIGGEIDAHTAPRVRERLAELLDQGQYRIVVDTERVDFMDSTGLGVLVGALKRVRTNNGELALVCSESRILKVFEITGLTKVFPMHRTLADVSAPG